MCVVRGYVSAFCFNEKAEQKNTSGKQKNTRPDFFVRSGILMELITGFEPVTSSLPRTRSTNWAISARRFLSISLSIILNWQIIVKRFCAIYQNLFFVVFFDVFVVFVGRGGFRHIVRRETIGLPYGLERGNGRTEGISCVRPQTSVNKPSLLRQAVPPHPRGETLKEAAGGLNKKNCSDCMKKYDKCLFFCQILSLICKRTQKKRINVKIFTEFSH